MKIEKEVITPKEFYEKLEVLRLDLSRKIENSTSEIKSEMNDKILEFKNEIDRRMEMEIKPLRTIIYTVISTIVLGFFSVVISYFIPFKK